MNMKKPNECDDFDKFINDKFGSNFINEDMVSYFRLQSAWQHQQNRIDELEEIANRPVTDNTQLIANMESMIESLQAQLTIAVNALEIWASGKNPYFYAQKTLAEIKNKDK